jgi:hypothetical protein
MIAFIIRSYHTALDLWHFTDAVIADMRQTRKDLQDTYGPLGF